MFRYLAFLWDPFASEQQHAIDTLSKDLPTKLPHWVLNLSVPGLSVYTGPSVAREGEVIELPGRTGLILGVSFPTKFPLGLEGHTDRSSILSALPTEELIASRGRLAINSLWGSYVLAFTARDLRTRYLLRSPAALLACYRANIQGVNVFFSTVDDYLAISRRPPSINWAVIRAQAVGGDYVTQETGLNEVTAVEGGECVVHTSAGITNEFYWNPCEIARGPSIETFDDAVAAIRRETLRAVQNWAARYNRIILELSGGLDSSIVLAALAAARRKPDIFCANFHSRSTYCDERHFARASANKAQATLLEFELDPSCDLALFTSCVRTARPALDYTAPGRLPSIATLTQDVGGEAVFDGELGDDVFGRPPAAAPVSDYLQRRGPGLGVVRVARDLARLQRLSVWRALEVGLSWARHPSWSRSYYAYLKNVSRMDMETLRFVTREAWQDYEDHIERFSHPWFQEGVVTSPSTFQLIYALIMTTSTALHSPFLVPNSPPYVRPLVSQPLIEVALRIPSNFAIRGGWNRAVARAAFASELPEEIRLRVNKTAASPWVCETIRKNSSWIRAFLLDGILARERILDRKRVEAALSETLSGVNTILSQLFIHLYIEGWLRQWSS